MKYLVHVFFVFISLHTFSQVDNPCEVDGVEVVASMFYFEPQNISINLGQTVYWLNIQGFHDVNAVNNTLTNEPFNNPEPFSLDAIQGNSSGVCIGYHTFSVPGIYNYDCSIYGHALNGMVGTIEVGIGGCMDQSADNYDENAEYDNGTCCYIGELSIDILPALCSDDIASLNIISTSDYNLNYEILDLELSNTTGQFELDEGEYDIVLNMTDSQCYDTVTVLIPPSPEEITLIVETIDATVTQLGSGTATASGGTGSIIIEWFDENGNSISADSLEVGSYFVTATDENSCSETVYTGVFFNSISLPTDPVFNFFPNPTSGIITFESINSLEHIYLLNSIGEKVLEVDTDGKEIYELDISSLKPGIYYVSVKNICKKLILK